ncbi:MAG: hypothetical protein IJX22_05705 [Opitutales bacterium]|nr:hypothetical protein [Opitutales bacterium]
MNKNLPELPSGFHAGEPVRAEDFNKMLEWMRAVQQFIENTNSEPGETGGSALPFWFPRERAPFEVDVEYDENGNPDKIIVARGNVFSKQVRNFVDNEKDVLYENQMERLNAFFRCEVDATELVYRSGAKITLLIRDAGWPTHPAVFARVAFEDDKKDGEVPFPLAELREDTETGDVVVQQHHKGNVFFAWQNWSSGIIGDASL